MGKLLDELLETGEGEHPMELLRTMVQALQQDIERRHRRAPDNPEIIGVFTFHVDQVYTGDLPVDIYHWVCARIVNRESAAIESWSSVPRKLAARNAVLGTFPIKNDSDVHSFMTALAREIALRKPPADEPDEDF